ncbi:MAG: FAD-containing oxidoreductase [Acidimicrobiia bacterium]|nr:FAD-containing oxidoreductase [Acidimicrobiia bacterium]
MATRYDAIVIGTGQAGPSLAGRMDQEGMKVAVIERNRVGGTCVNTGCIPTKTLVASARAAHMARRGSDFGIDVDGPIGVDMKRVKDRMKTISGASNRGLTDWLEGMENVDLIRGDARLLGPDRVGVNDQVLASDRIFLNVGGRPAVPEFSGIDKVPYFTNVTMLEVDFVPEHLVIVGGGYIGLEFAQMYRRFGSEVTVIERDSRLIGQDDPDVSDCVREILEAEGVRFRLEADCIGFSRQGESVVADVECAVGSPEIVGSHLLLAVGRTPNTDGLGLEEAGVATDERGFVQVDDQLRTNVPGIWALGDCNGKGAFTHTAYNDYEIVAANLFDNDPRRVSDRVLCYGLFTDPPLGRIGMTEQQAHDSGRNVLIGKRPMKHVGRAKERSETDGFIKILVDGDTEEILGAAILGIGGDEVVHTLLDVMYARAPYTVISRAVHIHPTVAELVPTTLQTMTPL